jgi:hypothetical protein
MGISTFSDVPSNPQIEVCSRDDDTHFNRGRLRVFGRVRQGFGNNVVRRHCSSVRQPSVDTEVEFHRDRTAAGPKAATGDTAPTWRAR